MTKKIIHEELTFLNIYTSYDNSSKYFKCPWDVKEEKDGSTIVVGDFNTLISMWSIKWVKTPQANMDLRKKIKVMSQAELMKVEDAQGTFSKIDPILDHKK